MSQPSLDDAFDKLGRAKQHFDCLRPQIDAFQQKDRHTFSFSFDPEAGKYAFYIHGIETPDPNWGLIVGDCLHNARVALDYLIVRLVALVTGDDPRNVDTRSFPIKTDPSSFPHIGEFISDKARRPLFSGYLTRIEELQPYNNANPSIWKVNWARPLHQLPLALEDLESLDIIDKHRVVHAMWGYPNIMQSNLVTDTYPSTFVLVDRLFHYGPLEDGTQIAELTFETPLPSEWNPTQMEMQGYFPVHITLGDDFALIGILETLTRCIWAVQSVLNIFQPVFTDGQPPLPVTTVENLRP